MLKKIKSLPIALFLHLLKKPKLRYLGYISSILARNQ